MKKPLRVVLIKPSHYHEDGYLSRFRVFFMPNTALSHMAGLTPREVDGRPVETCVIDEVIERDLDYLALLRADPGFETVVALVGVMSLQFPRALDLAAYARHHGVEHVVVGGPHPITCDTTEFHGLGVSFALGEAENIWTTILNDAAAGELQPVYGEDQRWASELKPTVSVPPTRRALKRYVARMMGVYPARGCPYRCTFCSIIKIAGRKVRSQPVEATLETLRVAKAAGVRQIMFTSDNFNKYPEAQTLLHAMIDDPRTQIPFFAQVDTQIVRQPDLVALMSRAGCREMFVGVESFDRKILETVNKYQNHPSRYEEIIRLCNEYDIVSHFSNIIGFEHQDEAGVEAHLQELMRQDPDVASFFILTPIPGTEQYDDFMRRGLVTAKSLNEQTCVKLVWKHPNFTAPQLEKILFDCYRKFYGTRRYMKTIKRCWRKTCRFPHLDVKTQTFSFWALIRVSIGLGMHPMAGGFFRKRVDHCDEYRQLRRERFDVDEIPMPSSRPVPEKLVEEQLRGSTDDVFSAVVSPP